MSTAEGENFDNIREHSQPDKGHHLKIYSYYPT